MRPGMTISKAQRFCLVAAALAAALIYGRGLDVSPIYLTHDEVIYARNAYSIAQTGRDLSGRLLPISIPVTGTFYATPANIYLTAAFLELLPLSEVTIRLPSVLVGLLGAWLVFLIARRLLGSETFGAIAAAILLMTPAQFIHSRLGTDHLYVVVCVLAWLLVIVASGNTPKPARIAAATAFLGASLYTYIGALITAPVCVALTFGWLVAIGKRDARSYIAALAGFLIPALPFMAWHLAHPGQYANQIRMYALYDSRMLSAAEGARAMAAPTSLAERGAVYWDYFNPSFLFFAGDTGLLNGTRYSGVFLIPMMVLIPIGIAALVVRAGSVRMLVLALFATSPAAAVVVAERYRINRALILLPMAAIVAAAGAEWMWHRRARLWRWALIALLLAMPVQFAAFYHDYFGAYRVRSYAWFEYNLRGGIEEILRRAGPAQTVWISQSLHWADYYWPFYLDRFGRADLKPPTHYLDPERADLSAAGPGTLVLCPVNEERRFLDAGFTRVAAVEEPDRTHSLSVLRR